MNNTNSCKQRLAICVSGGADSMYLLYRMTQGAVLDLGIDYDPEIHVLHVNHGINPQSNDWENLVKSFCQKQNVFFSCTRLNLGNINSIPTETECRNKRWAWIENYCLENGITIVLTAHHKDDDNENKFISIFRNRTNEFSQPKLLLSKGGFLIKMKPLLEMSKQSILDECNKLNIPYVHDPSNDDEFCLRNIIRNGLFKKIHNLEHSENYIAGMDAFFEHYVKVNDFFNLFITSEANKVSNTASEHVSNSDWKSYKKTNYSNLHEFMFNKYGGDYKKHIHKRFTLDVTSQNNDYLGDIFAQVCQFNGIHLTNKHIHMIQTQVAALFNKERQGAIVIDKLLKITASNNSEQKSLFLFLS